MNEREIYILLTDTGTLFTKMIKLYTRKPYNHASIALDNELMRVYSFGRKKHRNPFIGGFVKEDVRKGLFRHANCAIYRLKVTDGQYERMVSFIRNIEENKHRYRYNLIGLLSFIIHKQINRENAFFCSQFVATVLQECGIIKFEKKLSFMTPYDLQQAANLCLVYQGRLADFVKEGASNGFAMYTLQSTGQGKTAG